MCVLELSHLHYFLFTFTAHKFFLLQSKSDDEFEIIEMQVNLFIQPLLALDRASNVFEIDSVDVEKEIMFISITNKC